MSTWVWLSTSVSINMLLQFRGTFKHLPTVTTVIRSSVAVHLTFMWLQMAGSAETFVTHWTIVWFVCCMDSYVSGKGSRLSKCLVTLGTYVWFLPTVNSAVSVCARSVDRVNCLLQTVHSNGFSPEWSRLCTVNSWLLLQHFSHSMHLYLLLWTFICFLKKSRVPKRFSHSVHEYTLSTLCICLCLFRFLFCLNRLSQTVHKYGLGLSSCGCSVISPLSASIFTSNAIPVCTQQTCIYSNQITSYIGNQICPQVTGVKAKAKFLVANIKLSLCT